MHSHATFRHHRDSFVALRNPFAARWSTLQLAPFSALADTGHPDTDADDDGIDADDPEGHPVDHDQDDADDDGAEQTAEPEGQFPNGPDQAMEKSPVINESDRGGVS